MAGLKSLADGSLRNGGLYLLDVQGLETSLNTPKNPGHRRPPAALCRGPVKSRSWSLPGWNRLPRDYQRRRRTRHPARCALKVNVYPPDAVPTGNVMVAFASADEPPTLTDAGLIAQVAPCGPLQVSATLPVKPF